MEDLTSLAISLATEGLPRSRSNDSRGRSAAGKRDGLLGRSSSRSALHVDSTAKRWRLRYDLPHFSRPHLIMLIMLLGLLYVQQRENFSLRSQLKVAVERRKSVLVHEMRAGQQAMRQPASSDLTLGTASGDFPSHDGRAIVMSCPHGSSITHSGGWKPTNLTTGIAAVAGQMEKFKSKLRLIVSFFEHERDQLLPWCRNLQIKHQFKVKIECFQVPVAYPDGYGVAKSK
jgi:hypothetical protein